jgi:hypothetical protein
MSYRRPSSPSLMGESSTNKPRRPPHRNSRGDVPPAVGAPDDAAALAGIAATPPVGIPASAYSCAGATAHLSPRGHSRGDIPPAVGAADDAAALAGIAAAPLVGIAAPAYSRAGATAGRIRALLVMRALLLLLLLLVTLLPGLAIVEPSTTGTRSRLSLF